MKISLILVTHYSAAEARAALRSFRAELAACGVAGEVVIVEHSEDAAEEHRLQDLAPDQLLVRPNRGYAAGLNTGIAASTGEIVVLANPDVELGEGALGALLDALAGGWDIVGPLFHLGPWLFPPSDVQTPTAELGRWLATLAPSLWLRHMKREARRGWQLWTARRPQGVGMLSGALLAMHRRTAVQVGAWDEGYFLYFEETDWLRRAVKLGLRLAQVPAARVRHEWGHAARPDLHGGTFAASRRRFYARHYGILGKLVTRLPAGKPPTFPLLPPVGERPGSSARWMASPSAWGFPAAGGEGVDGGGLEAALPVLSERGRGGRPGQQAAVAVAWRPPSAESEDLAAYRIER